MKRDIYLEYAKASNLPAVGVYLIMLLGAQTGQIGESHRKSPWSVSMRRDLEPSATPLLIAGWTEMLGGQHGFPTPELADYRLRV